jgi:hypothetical protein
MEHRLEHETDSWSGYTPSIFPLTVALDVLLTGLFDSRTATQPGIRFSTSLYPATITQADGARMLHSCNSLRISQSRSVDTCVGGVSVATAVVSVAIVMVSIDNRRTQEVLDVATIRGVLTNGGCPFGHIIVHV